MKKTEKIGVSDKVTIKIIKKEDNEKLTRNKGRNRNSSNKA